MTTLTENKVKRFNRKHCFEGYCFDVVVDHVLWPNQKKLDRDLIVHPGISIFVPLLDETHMILIRQYRYGAGKFLWELPAGTLGEKETPLACAKREIEEEIGYRAKKWRKIISCFATPGYSTEIIHGFIAKDLIKVSTALEHDEVLVSKVFSVSQVKEMIKKHRIEDARSLALLYHFFIQREK